MLLKTRGKTHIIEEPIVTKVTRDPLNMDPNTSLIIEGDFPESSFSHFKTILTTSRYQDHPIDKPSVHSVQTFDHLSEEDIIVINSDGVINTLFRPNSQQNFLLFTERCNSNCLMCSQPPRDRDDIPYLFHIHRQVIPLIPKNCQELGITGGEPTLLGNFFFELLSQIKSELPEMDLHCLTNGRSFAWEHVAKRLGQMDYHKLMLGIPVYSDYYQIHDYIVQAKDAFNQTIQGLYNLANYGVRIELRIVLHKASIPRLKQLARYIYKNLPFVEHVAFMGLEYQGYTPYNIDKLWIEPADYMDDLTETVEFLSSRDINVSIYNSQLCLMPQELWRFNKKSISDWKNIYLEECSKCALSDQCGGLFASSEKKHPKFIKAFEEVIEP